MTREEILNYMREKHKLERYCDYAINCGEWEEAEMLLHMIDSINETLEEEKITIWEEF